MTAQTYYGAAYPSLRQAEQTLLDLLENYRQERPEAVLYLCSRLKSPGSAGRKLAGRGLPSDGEAALEHLRDLVGVRLICPFQDDVYRAVDWLAGQETVAVTERKDYIASPKANGYRSYHLILTLTAGPARGQVAEVQIRTIAADFWAALEHQIKYKRQVAHEDLVRAELKRCADEIASVDLSMETLRELLAQSP